MITIQTLLDLLEQSGYEFTFEGDPNTALSGFSSLSQYREGTVAWARNSEALKSINVEKISCVVLPAGLDAPAPNRIVVDDPRRIFFFLIERVWGEPKKPAGVGAHTFVSPEARIGKNVSIGCNCTIDGPVVIGEGTVIEHNVTLLNRVEIGNDCIVHSGAVIGGDGFGYTYDENNRPVKIEHFGGVRLGDRVEVGANACIDRGVIDDTVVGQDTKIDDLVHIAHNAQVGDAVIAIMGTNICGSAVVGAHCYFAPGAIIKNGVHIGENSFLGMGVVASGNVEPNTMLYKKPPLKLKNVDYRKLL